MKTYRVKYWATGWTAPTEKNPNGIRVKAVGYILVPGKRPKSTRDVPHTVIEFAKKEFIRKTGCVRLDGDRPGFEVFPTIQLLKT